eukprot:3849151-Rhodomonas_salina.2
MLSLAAHLLDGAVDQLHASEARRVDLPVDVVRVAHAHAIAHEEVGPVRPALGQKIPELDGREPARHLALAPRPCMRLSDLGIAIQAAQTGN